MAKKNPFKTRVIKESYCPDPSKDEPADDNPQTQNDDSVKKTTKRNPFKTRIIDEGWGIPHEPDDD